MLCSHASRSHVSGLPCDVFPSASLSPPPLPGLTFDGDGGTTRCPDSIRRPTVGVGRLGACTTPTTVTCYATTTDSDYRCGVPPHVALRVHTHAGGTIPWYTSTDVARVTTVVAGEPSIHAVNSPELAGYRDPDGNFSVAYSSRDQDPDVFLVVPNSLHQMQNIRATLQETGRLPSSTRGLQFFRRHT